MKKTNERDYRKDITSTFIQTSGIGVDSDRLIHL